MNPSAGRSYVDYAIGAAAVILLIACWIVIVNITAVDPVDWPAGVQATPVIGGD